MGPIVLLKNFTFVLATNDEFRTDWVPFPSGHKNALLHVHIQTMDPSSPTTGLITNVETSFDTVEATALGSLTSASTGSSNRTYTDDIEGLVRVLLTNTDAATLSGICSVWLQPKSE